MRLSLIIPVYNEEENLGPLYEEIIRALINYPTAYEVIFINDGSTDKSLRVLKNLAGRDNRVKIISFLKNFGQTAAISAGIKHSSNEVIIPLDADGQNDPADILRLLEKMNEGYDVVSGWRENRKEPFLTRRLPSSAANKIISLITKIKLHDYGCTLKAYKRDVIKDIQFYGEMHRFIPAYAAWYNAKITEIPVNHRARRRGQSKYGLSRVFRVILDLLTVKFLSDYFTKPIYFFGKLGFWSLSAGFLSGFYAIYLKIFKQVYFSTTPLPLLTAFFIIVGWQFILMGLLAEIIIRVYHESQTKETYLIKEKINFD